MKGLGFLLALGLAGIVILLRRRLHSQRSPEGVPLSDIEEFQLQCLVVFAVSLSGVFLLSFIPVFAILAIPLGIIAAGAIAAFVAAEIYKTYVAVRGVRSGRDD